MYQFFITPENIRENDIVVTSKQEVNHIRNVLRMKEGEKLAFCCPEKEKEYLCRITAMTAGEIYAAIEDIQGNSRELPVEMTLFQGLPKGDKMEWIMAQYALFLWLQNGR